MNKGFSVIAVVIAGLVFIASFAGGVLFGKRVVEKTVESQFGGTTNYNSLQLTPAASSDNALLVEDAAGNDILTITGFGVATFSSSTQVDRLRYGNGYLAISASTTLSAAQVCNNSIVDVSWSNENRLRLVFPTSTSLTADCLQAIGDQKWLYVRNLASQEASSTVLQAGPSSTIRFLSATTTYEGASTTIYGGWSSSIQLIYVTSSQASAAMIETIVHNATSSVRSQ